MTLRLKAFADKDDPRLRAMNDDKQVVIKPARVGAVAAFAATCVVSYLTAVSYLVVRGGQSPIETLGTVLDRFLTGNYSSSAGTKLKADQSAHKSKFAPGGGITRAKPGQSREVSRQPEPLPESNRAPDSTVRDAGLAARGESPTAFGRRCIPSGCVAPPSNIPDILGRHALPARRLARLGATPDFHHGLCRSLSWFSSLGTRIPRLSHDQRPAGRYISWLRWLILVVVKSAVKAKCAGITKPVHNRRQWVYNVP